MIFLNRTACLGGDVTQYKFGENHNFNNQQKVRVDMFMDIISGNLNKPNSKIIRSLLSKPEITGGIYDQSEELRWLNIKNKPDCLIMDNFSELVDKKIFHKDGWSFCGTFGDFNPDSFINGTLIDGSLLEIDLIKCSYDRFFNYIKKIWNVPIIFIHFPSTFDKRDIYKMQAESIFNALSELSPIYNIQNIYADVDYIQQKDENPYHFTEKTVINMANKIIF